MLKTIEGLKSLAAIKCVINGTYFNTTAGADRGGVRVPSHSGSFTSSFMCRTIVNARYYASGQPFPYPYPTVGT